MVASLVRAEVGATELVGGERDGSFGIGHTQQRLGQPHQRQSFGTGNRVLAQQRFKRPERGRPVAHGLHPRPRSGHDTRPFQRRLDRGRKARQDVHFTAGGVRKPVALGCGGEGDGLGGHGQFPRFRQRAPKDRRAHPHDRRAFGNRRLQIGGHAHRQGVDVQALALQPSQQFAQSRVREALRGHIDRRRRHGHQTAQPHPRQGGHRARHGQHLIDGQAALAGLTADVDLQAQLKRRQAGRALLAQALGDLQAIDGVDPVKGCGHGTGLVALQRPDQVPLEALAQIGQRGDLVERFLHVVLTEASLPRIEGGPHGLGRERFAHRQQRDAFHGPVGERTGRSDALPHFLYVFSDRRHNLCQYLPITAALRRNCRRHSPQPVVTAF